jgi:NACHT domain
LAGTGKSTIARTVARTYFDQTRLGASFFFSRGGGDVGHAGKFVTSIAVQLATSIPSLDKHMCDALTECRNIASQSLHDQWQQLVVRPLSKLDGNGCQSSYLLVVDALDECDNDDDIRIVIHLLGATRLLRTVRLRVFLTSRPEVPIRNGFVQMPDTEHQDFILHNISQSIVDHDIRIFLEHNLGIIARERSLGIGCPGAEVLKRLVQNASGLFIWAATAYRFIRDGKMFADKRLDTILQHSSGTVNAPEKHLNEIYLAVLRHSISKYSDEEAEELQSMIKSLLGSIITLRSPLSTQTLSHLLNSPHAKVNQILDHLHSILDIPKDSSHALRLHHPSFRDFLYEKTRCEEFWVDEMQHFPDQGRLNRLRSVRFQPSDRKLVFELTHRHWWLAVEHETECPLLRYLKRSDR